MNSNGCTSLSSCQATAVVAVAVGKVALEFVVEHILVDGTQLAAWALCFELLPC